MPTQQRPAPKAPAPVKTTAKAPTQSTAKTVAPGPVAAPQRPKATAAPKPSTPAQPAKLPKVPKVPKPPKATKPSKAPKLRTKPVRDSFTMPEADFALIATLKARALSARREAKKSELLRAGLHALAALDTQSLVAALGQLEPIKVGRPKKGH